jgi:formamidopyrimidine-DNA glycosylase
MPELPEVEITRRNLEHWLDRRVVIRAEADRSRIFRGSSRDAFEKRLSGRRLESISRRGKYLLLRFDGDQGLMSHLGMTGKWVVRPASQPEPYSRARLIRDDGAVIHYRDTRLFGRMEVVPASKLESIPAVARLGPDPVVDGLTPKVLAERLSRTAREIKVALLDQSIVAGIGNIQAAEALWRARIDPRRRANQLDREEVKRLCQAIHFSIRRSLANEMSEEIEYVEEPGSENPFLVYGRKGEPCPRCHRRIASLGQGGRTTYYCPHCQKRRR